MAELAVVLGRAAVTGVEALEALAALEALEARSAIRELPARYADAYARLDLDALVALYVPDVALHDGTRGRAALRGHFERATRDAQLAAVILQTGSHSIELTGPDTATGVVYCRVEAQQRDGGGYWQAVVYRDTYARRDGAWLFAGQRRHDLVVGAPPLSRPNGLPPARWPRSQTGRGTFPDRVPSWGEFWRGR